VLRLKGGMVAGQAEVGNGTAEIEGEMKFPALGHNINPAIKYT